MCAVCGFFTCHPSCPNAPEPKSFGECEECRDEIYDGEEMVEIEGKTFHYDCLTVDNILEALGVRVKVAGDD